jgi:hypothetical protein
MRLDFYGLSFHTASITFYLFSPWRGSHLEHRVFEAIRILPDVRLEKSAEEWRVVLSDPRTVKVALTAVERVMKGWQEDAEPGSERRFWRWVLEADTDSNGYDHVGERVALWGYLRLAVERGGPSDADQRAEEIDLDWFGFQIHGVGEGE